MNTRLNDWQEPNTKPELSGDYERLDPSLGLTFKSFWGGFDWYSYGNDGKLRLSSFTNLKWRNLDGE